MCRLSVIVTVYNTEQYLQRCIDSLTEQTYKDAEFIFVNDCSPGNAEEIIKKNQAKDNRIKYFTYEKNKGLFRARIEGAEKARGKYIAFMDSDDYASSDYYNTLIRCLEDKSADIAIGKTIFKRMDNSNLIRNLHDECFTFDKIEGEEVKKAYFSQKGLCFSWHTVWNKVYRKELWDKCFPYYKKMDRHIIMTEDIAFSSLLFYNARSIACVENDGYYYCENENASTNSSGITLKRFIKNMEDMKAVFDFVSSYLDEVKAEQYIKDCFFETRKYYARMWNELGDNAFRGKEHTEAKKALDNFITGFSEHTNADFHFFESIETKWNNGLESIKEEVTKGSCRYISFDIFDTLIMRCVYKPDDIFLLMNKRFRELYECNISFEKIRKGAERECRRRFGSKSPEYQDVTLSEIYECMADYYNIPYDTAIQMKEEEIRLEKQLCRRRKASAEIYNAAQLSGKEIILISDMYLEKDTIRSILKDAGYDNYKKLYLSSELRLTKSSGDLFKAVLEDLNAKPDDILHIGDTWINDIERPQSLGIRTVFFPKAKEVFENKIKNLNTNLCRNIGKSVCGAICNSNEFENNLAYRCMLALVCGKYFDNPYRSFNENSDFNADPYFIGYYALGSHLLGLSEWIRNNSKEYDKIFFMARDGYIPMLAYEIYKNPGDPEAQYLYASRKLLLPAMIEKTPDFFDLPVEFRNHTPATILSLLDFCCGKYNALPFDMDKPFENIYDYDKFIEYFIDNLYDGKKHKEALSRLEKYYAPAAEGKNISFDMGYSGRIQTALSRVCGKGIDALFVHRDSKRSGDMALKGNYKIKCFYDFYPNMSGLIREHILSDYSASCIGLDENLNPVFDNIQKLYQDKFVIERIQSGALDFMRDFKNIFGEYKDLMGIKPYEISMTFEGYLRCAKDIDRRIFKASYFEDIVYGSKDNINIYDFIRSYLLTLPINEEAKNAVTKRDMLEEVVSGHSKFLRALAYLTFDKQLFKLYVIGVLSRKPKLLKFLVKIKHIFFGVGGRNE